MPVRVRGPLRIVAWNVLLLAAGLALIAGVGEAWLRLTFPFASPSVATHFVPDVGLILRPDTEIRHTRYFDYWTVSRTNRLGFLDREPIGPARAAESCHVTMIGDSFVAAKEVSVADKFHVRLEEMAARKLPRLDVTTSAFGRGGTGQFNQLPFYDKFARPLRPRLLVLVFVSNDFADNYPLREHLPYTSARRAEDGSIQVLPPDPAFRDFPPFARRPANSWPRAFIRRVRSASYFNQWLRVRAGLFHRWEPPFRRNQPGTAAPGASDAPLPDELRDLFVERWRAGMKYQISRLSALLTPGNDSPLSREILAFTASGLDEFRKRAERDGVSLLILSTHSLGTRGDVLFDRLSALAEARDVPVVDQYDYIRRRGGLVREAHWERDFHWNEQGHQWAAESLFEYIERNPDVCGGGRRTGGGDPEE